MGIGQHSHWGRSARRLLTTQGVFLARQYMLTRSRMTCWTPRGWTYDSEWKVYWQIVLRCLPRRWRVMVIFFSVMWRLKEFLWPLIVLIRSKCFKLQSALTSVQIGESANKLVKPDGNDRARRCLRSHPSSRFLQKYITQGIQANLRK